MKAVLTGNFSVYEVRQTRLHFDQNLLVRHVANMIILHIDPLSDLKDLFST